MKIALWAQGHSILIAQIMRWDNPSPAVVVPFVFFPIPTFFYSPPHIHFPMFKKLQSLYEYNIQRCSLLPRARKGREWLNKAQEAAASTSCGQGPGGKGSWHWGPASIAVGGEVGSPSKCHSLRLH
jgi:hypothetical protein